VMIADLILVLDKGRIIQKGTHTELLEQPGVYRQIYDIQTRIDAEVEQEVGDAHAAEGAENGWRENGHEGVPQPVAELAEEDALTVGRRMRYG